MLGFKVKHASEIVEIYNRFQMDRGVRIIRNIFIRSAMIKISWAKFFHLVLDSFKVGIGRVLEQCPDTHLSLAVPQRLNER